MGRRWWWMAVGLAACTPLEGETGFVLVDPDARDAGVRVFVDEEEVEGLLPEAVEADAQVALMLPGELVEVFVEPGVVHHVQGPSGRVEPWFIGTDIGAEQVVVDATEEAAEDLASEMGADLEEVRDGWLLTGPELWAELAAAEVPRGLYELLPVSDLDLPGVVTTDAPLAAAGGDRVVAGVLSWLGETPGPEDAERAADAQDRQVVAAYDLGSPDWVVAPSEVQRGTAALVGRYCRDGRAWTLDALGTARVDGMERGAWSLDELGRVTVSDGAVLRVVRGGIEDVSGAVFADGVKGGCDDDAP